jgi:hypothetical protein
MFPHGILRGPEKLIHEKNLKSKISYKTPFKKSLLSCVFAPGAIQISRIFHYWNIPCRKPRYTAIATQVYNAYQRLQST